MNKARLNYSVDAVIAVTFLVTAITGVLFLLPAPLIKALGLGMPGMLGLSFHAWHWLHDWSGVVATAGIVVHFALHWRWVVAMTRRTFGASAPSARRRAGSRGGAPTAPAGPATTAAATSPAKPRPYSVYGATPRSKPDEQRYTRRGVLAGAAAVAATVLVSAGLLERLSRADASTTQQTASGQAVATTDQAQSAGAGQGGTSTRQSNDAGAAGTTEELVSVDAASCVGCGRCLGVCPANVFAWDGSGQHATAQNPSACIRCHRCLQTCPASAITVNG
jgi:NAD-dependent dihydropyrimidine dehydrogenase PreA subunit